MPNIKKYKVDVVVDLPISFTKTIDVEVDTFRLSKKAIENAVKREATEVAKEQWENGDGYGTEFKLCTPEQLGVHETIDGVCVIGYTENARTRVKQHVNPYSASISLEQRDI